jgi:hypothetical protein
MALLKVTLNKIGFGRTKFFSQEILKFGFSTNSFLPTKMTDDKLKERQRELMAKSLPKKRRLPGVKHVILVSLRSLTFNETAGTLIDMNRLSIVVYDYQQYAQ